MSTLADILYHEMRKPGEKKKAQSKTSQKKPVYVEPADYFPKDVREEYKLGEFSDEE